MMTVSTKAGAPAAYRGYRLQALYTLDLALDSLSDDNKIIMPEGQEDIDVLVNGQLQIAIQIKSYPELTLSDLDPSNPRAFLHRAKSLLLASSSTAIELVNFGKIGPELIKSWMPISKCPKTFIKKLQGAGFTVKEIELLLSKIKIQTVDESNIYNRVRGRLAETVGGIDPDAAFDLLNFWLYGLAEQKRAVPARTFVDKLHDIGRFLSERNAHLAEWNTSILPLTTEGVDDGRLLKLKNEFYQGTSATKDHITAGLDVRRPVWIQAVTLALETNGIVIIHAASGQGKTTLALRYIHDYFPTHLSYAVSFIEGRQHAARIALALSGYARVLGTMIAIHVDVSPRDSDWAELVYRLSEIPHIKILVTIREEDYRRAEIAVTEFRFKDISLELRDEEAQNIFSELYRRSESPRYFTSFDEAWAKFGGSGPLLEFVYLLTNTESLQSRLKSQILRIRREIQERNRHPDELRLLQIAAVATAYEAQIDVLLLSKAILLPDILGTLQMFEKEYLIRRSEDGKFLEALHPVRSMILTDLLCDSVVSPWISVAIVSLNLIKESGIGDFLLRGLLEHESEQKGLLSAARQRPIKTWVGFAGVLRAHRWTLIRSDVLYADDSENPEIRTLRIDLVSWLAATAAKIPEDPATEDDWKGVAYSWFSLSQLEIRDSRFMRIGETAMQDAVLSLPLFLLSELSVAMHLILPGRHKYWWNQHRRRIIERSCAEYGIFALKEDSGALVTHYIYNEGRRKGVDERDPHAGTLERIQLIRQFIPTSTAYGAQAYWHSHGEELPYDDTRKTGIPLHSLPPSSITLDRRLFTNLRLYQERPLTWTGFLQPILNLRRQTVVLLFSIEEVLSRTDFDLSALLKSSTWVDTRDLLRKRTLLPKTVVDPFGFSSEISGSASGSSESSKSAQYNPATSISLEKYQPFLKAYDSYSCKIVEFLDHLKGWSTKRPSDSENRERNQRLSIQSISEAIELIEPFYSEFRNLFQNLIDTSEINRLESQEVKVLNSILQIWLFRSQSDITATDKIPAKLAAVRDEYTRTVLECIKIVGVTAGLRLDISCWRNESALWIIAYVDSVETLGTLAQNILNCMHDGLAMFKNSFLFDYVTSHKYKHTVILPVYRGRAVSRGVLRFLTTSVVWGKVDLSDPEHSWKRALVTIESNDIWKRLGYEVWADFSPFTQLVLSVSRFWSRLAKISTLMTAPGAEPEAVATSCKIVENALAGVNDFVETVKSSVSGLVNAIRQIRPDELDSRPYWKVVIGKLDDLAELLSLPVLENSQATIEDLHASACQLERAVNLTTTMHLCWIAEIPEKVDSR